MDLRQIRYFVAVYEEGSISAAAKREHCTQPGISVQIQRLEASISHKLFEREARGVTPTVAGRHLYACCLGVLDELRNARQHMIDLKGSMTGAITIGVPPTLSVSALPKVLPGFLARHPHVEVRVSEAFSGTLTNWVMEGDLDIAIVTEPPEHLGLTTQPFLRDELLLVMGQGHHTKPPAPRRWRDLRDMKLIVPSGKHTLRQTVAHRAGLGSGRSRSRGRLTEVDGMIATLELVRNSDWVTVLPIFAVHERIEQGELVGERLADSDLFLDFYLVHQSHQPVPVAARELLTELKREAERTSAEWRAADTSAPREQARIGRKNRQQVALPKAE